LLTLGAGITLCGFLSGFFAFLAVLGGFGIGGMLACGVEQLAGVLVRSRIRSQLAGWSQSGHSIEVSETLEQRWCRLLQDADISIRHEAAQINAIEEQTALADKMARDAHNDIVAGFLA
jgi:hypothetical protein